MRRLVWSFVVCNLGRQIFLCRGPIVNTCISLPISFNICFGCSKENEMALTHVSFGCSKEPSHWDGSFKYPLHNKYVFADKLCKQFVPRSGLTCWSWSWSKTVWHSKGVPERIFLKNLIYRLLIIFANSFNPDQAGQNVGLDLDPNYLTLW